MVRQPPRHAARRRHDVDVGVPIVLACEGDRLPIRGEDRAPLVSHTRRQAPGLSPLPAGDPEVPGERKRDLCPADGRRPQKLRLLLLRTGLAGREKQQGQ